jgi:hypothetical protein
MHGADIKVEVILTTCYRNDNYRRSSSQGSKDPSKSPPRIDS